LRTKLKIITQNKLGLNGKILKKTFIKGSSKKNQKSRE
jgi:hypothetical protein